jgi:hypothetical protein
MKALPKFTIVHHLISDDFFYVWTFFPFAFYFSSLTSLCAFYVWI